MAATPSIKITNGYAIKNPNDPTYETNKSAYHKIREKRIIDHAEPKTIPKSTPWAFFHSMDSFYSQFYETILPFFCGKSRNRGEAICLTHPLL